MGAFIERGGRLILSFCSKGRGLLQTGAKWSFYGNRANVQMVQLNG